MIKYNISFSKGFFMNFNSVSKDPSSVNETTPPSIPQAKTFKGEGAIRDVTQPIFSHMELLPVDEKIDLEEVLNDIDKALAEINLFVEETLKNDKEAILDEHLSKASKLSKQNEDLADQLIEAHLNSPAQEMAKLSESRAKGKEKMPSQTNELQSILKKNESSNSGLRSKTELAKKIQTIGKHRGIIHSEGSSGPQNPSSDQSLAWNFYLAMLRRLPCGLGRVFAKFAVKNGKIQISEVEAKSIPKLSPSLIRLLSPQQLKELTPSELDRLDSRQIFAIGPRLKELGASNMAHIINHRLEPDGKISYLLDIARQWNQDQVDDAQVKGLLSRLEMGDIEQFLIQLEKNDFDQYEAILPLIFSSLNSSQFREMDEKLIKDIRADHLEAIGVETLGYLIAQKLDESDSIALLDGVIQRYSDGEIESHKVAGLLQAIGKEKKEAFLIALKTSAPDLFAEIYPMAFEKTVVGYSVPELLADQSFIDAPTKLKVTNSEGEEEVLIPLKIFDRDALGETYTFNGIDIDPIDRGLEINLRPSLGVVTNDTSMPRPAFVLEQLYEATGRNSELTKKVQILINQGTLAEPTKSFLEKYTLGLQVGFSILSTHHYLDITPPDPLAPNDAGSVNVKIENTVELLDIATRNSLGFMQMQTAISIPTNNLISGNGKKGQMQTAFSRVMPTKLELNEILTEKTSKKLFGPDQFKLKEELEEHYSDAKALEYASQRISIDNKLIRSVEIDAVKRLMRVSPERKLEEFQDANTQFGARLDVIHEIVENLRLPENSEKTTSDVANEVFDGLREVNELDFPNNVYGVELKDPSLRDNMVKRDCEIVQNMVLEEMEPYENKKLTSEEKSEIKANVLGAINKMDVEAQKQIEALNRELTEDEEVIGRFKKDLFVVMQEVLQEPKEKQLNDFQEKISRLKKDFSLEEFREGEALPVEDIMELCLGEMIQHLSGDIKDAVGSKNTDLVLQSKIEERFAFAKLALYENQINFPDRAARYAKMLVDRFFRVREAYS